jgi:hypothetical protein
VNRKEFVMQPQEKTMNLFAADVIAPTIADPSHILQVGFGFWSSKVLLTAVKLDVFTTLGDRAMTGEELGKAIGLYPRGIFDFFDALVALGFLTREGNGAEGCYRVVLQKLVGDRKFPGKESCLCNYSKDLVVL